MIRFLLIGCVLLGLQSVAYAGTEGDVFTIYLARHAEKETEAIDPANPSLSVCGELRAQALAEILHDIPLDKVYSSDYARTLNTARPSAEAHQLEIEIYDPRKLEAFSTLLQSSRQSALVVGHSNTTGVLAGLLAGGSGEEFDEDIYDRLYQVVFMSGQSRMNLLHQGFSCEP